MCSATPAPFTPKNVSSLSALAAECALLVFASLCYVFKGFLSKVICDSFFALFISLSYSLISYSSALDWSSFLFFLEKERASFYFCAANRSFGFQARRRGCLCCIDDDFISLQDLEVSAVCSFLSEGHFSEISTDRSDHLPSDPHVNGSLIPLTFQSLLSPPATLSQ